MRRSIAALAAVTMLVVVACAGDEADRAALADPSTSPDTALLGAEPSASPSPEPTVDPEGELCLLVGETGRRLASLRAVQLKLPNRVALEIELDKLVATHDELQDADLGSREDELERSLTRLGYRLGELELAVEDFRTNRHPRKAAPHVEEEAQKVADELSAFVILSRC